MTAAERLRSIWADRPTIVRASYVIDLEADLKLAGGQMPERRQRFDRIRSALDNIWSHRPVITTHAHIVDENIRRYDVGYRNALAEAADDAARIYETGFNAGSGNPPVPKPPCPRHGPATRTTPTGRSLVAVGP